MFKYLPLLCLVACVVHVPDSEPMNDKTEIHDNDINLPERPEDTSNGYSCNQSDVYPTINGLYVVVPRICDQFYFDQGDPPPDQDLPIEDMDPNAPQY